MFTLIKTVLGWLMGSDFGTALFLSACFFVSGFGVGYGVCVVGESVDTVKYAAEKNEQIRVLTEQVRQKELELVVKTNNAEERRLDEVAKINAYYERMRNDYERLRSDREGSRDAVRVSCPAPAPARACPPCRNEPHGAFIGALGIARDCDELAARYNSLLEIYGHAAGVSNGR